MIIAIGALRAYGLAGKVPICGQDAFPAGCNAVAKGELSLTIVKNGDRLAALASELAALPAIPFPA